MIRRKRALSGIWYGECESKFATFTEAAATEVVSCAAAAVSSAAAATINYCAAAAADVQSLPYRVVEGPV